MNKFIIFLLGTVTLLSSCKKDDSSVFNQSADERLNATLSKYQAQLSGAQFGWKALIYPKAGGAYSFYLKFNDSNRVKMYSDFDSSSAVTLKESSYRLKALQQPSLIFDTYSYIHLLSDPNEYIGVVANVNNGPSGLGLQSDFEFYFDSATPDSINLVGRYNGTKAVLVKATSQEEAGFNSGRLAAGFLVNRFLTYFKRVTIGTQLFDVQISPGNHTITLNYIDAGGVYKTFTTGYYLLPGGITFVDPLVVGSNTIRGFTNMQWIATTETITMTVNNVAGTISSVVVPIRVDVGAPKRWWDYGASNGDYWISQTGFHVNGKDDAYGITTLTSDANTYNYLIYWPAYASGNDFFGPIFLNAAQTGLTLIYGTAPRVPTFTADGRAIFVELGTYGTHPATGAAALTRAMLYNPSGYYFVQTGATSYDMVSAFDGKTWLTWTF